MSAPTIRKAVETDIKALCRLYYAFHEFHVAGVPDRLVTLGPIEKFDCSQLITELKKIIENHDAVILVAEMDDHIIGLAEIYLREDEPNPQRVAYRYGHLQSLMVSPEYRGRNIGKLLVTTAEDWALKKGAVETRLDTWEFKSDPIKFYEKCGYRTIRRKMVHQLK